MDTVAIAIEDFNIFLRDTLLEGAKLNRGTDALSMESYSTTSLTSISTEGLIDWVKDKLKKIGQKFVIVVNKVIARFSKNRAELEANIAKYKQNPKAEVKLAVSPKTLRNIGLTIAAIAAGIVAIFVCINRKGGKEQMAEVVNKVENKVKATEADIEKDKAKGGVTVSAGEAANATAASVAASKKTETVLKAAASKVAQGASGGDPASLKEKFTNTVAATKHSAMLAKHGYSLSKRETSSFSVGKTMSNMEKDKFRAEAKKLNSPAAKIHHLALNAEHRGQSDHYAQSYLSEGKEHSHQNSVARGYTEKVANVWKKTGQELKHLYEQARASGTDVSKVNGLLRTAETRTETAERECAAIREQVRKEAKSRQDQDDAREAANNDIKVQKPKVLYNIDTHIGSLKEIAKKGHVSQSELQSAINVFTNFKKKIKSASTVREVKRIDRDAENQYLSISDKFRKAGIKPSRGRD